MSRGRSKIYGYRFYTYCTLAVGQRRGTNRLSKCRCRRLTQCGKPGEAWHHSANIQRRSSVVVYSAIEQTQDTRGRCPPRFQVRSVMCAQAMACLSSTIAVGTSKIVQRGSRSKACSLIYGHREFQICTETGYTILAHGSTTSLA